jgi:hypothetical protein
MPGQCALMSALYSLALEKLGSQRGYVVAGSLHIGDKRVFGEDKKFDGKKLFSESNPRLGRRCMGRLWLLAHGCVVRNSLRPAICVDARSG